MFLEEIGIGLMVDVHQEVVWNMRESRFNRLWIDLDQQAPEWEAETRRLLQGMQPQDADIFEGFRVFTAGAFTLTLNEADDETWHYSAPRDVTWDLEGESAYVVARMGLYEFMHGVLAPMRHEAGPEWNRYLTRYEDVDEFEGLMGRLHDELAEAAYKEKYFSLSPDNVLVA